MGELKELVEALGYENVRTYIQSGNVIFDARGKVDGGALERAIDRRFSMSVGVALRSAAALRRALEANPFPKADESKLHVGFLLATVPASAAAGIGAADFAPEEFAVSGDEVFLHLPNGMGRAKLPAFLGRRLPAPVTYRNWNTVRKLAELAGA